MGFIMETKTEVFLLLIIENNQLRTTEIMKDGGFIHSDVSWQKAKAGKG